MTVDIVRAWKDREYRMSLTPEERANLPKNPAENPELTEDQLREISGGIGSASSLCCPTKKLE